MFAQACGTLMLSDFGEPFNGEQSEECRQFLDRLLNRLHEEEMNARTQNFDDPSLVQELFEVSSVRKVSNPNTITTHAY